MDTQESAFKLDEAIKKAIEVGKGAALPVVVEVTDKPDVDPHYLVSFPGDQGQEDQFQIVKSTVHPPTYKSGARTFEDVSSLVEYIAQHGTDNTTVTALRSGREIRCVFDDDGPYAPGRKVHTASVQCVVSTDWKKLKESNGRFMPQSEFVDLLREIGHLFVKPDAARLTDMVLNLSGLRTVTWESKVDLVSGAVRMSYVEDGVSASAGRQEARFPDSGAVSCEIFNGSAPIEDIKVEFQYRVSNEGKLTCRYVAGQLRTIEENAFDLVCASFSEACQRKLYRAP